MLEWKSTILNKISRGGDVEKKDDTINLIVSESSKRVQKELKTRHDWVSKVIHWKLFKRMSFHLTSKSYMQKQESFPKG